MPLTTIKTTGVTDDAITAALIADDAVGSAALADNIDIGRCRNYLCTCGCNVPRNYKWLCRLRAG